jgi:hypothetical protein
MDISTINTCSLCGLIIYDGIPHRCPQPICGIWDIPNGLYAHRPYRCPVCNGAGIVPASLYEPDKPHMPTEYLPCKSCQGTGIITI